jgi:hypothetical protein
MAIPLGRLSRAASRDRPGRQPGNRSMPSLFGLAPGGACHAGFVTESAVRSYRTFSPLPLGLKPVGGLFSVALSLESPPPDIIRHRVSVEPGLSSRLRATRSGAAGPKRSLSRRSPQGEDGRPSGHLTRGECRVVRRPRQVRREAPPKFPRIRHRQCRRCGWAGNGAERR